MVDWRLDLPRPARPLRDPYGNILHVLTLDEPHESVLIAAHGLVEIDEEREVEHDRQSPLPFLRSTRLTGADAENVDVSAFEQSVAERLGMPAEVQFRYRSPYFRHIFGSDGYASGYYTYLWAEVLDADGFELFKQKGIFDPATAAAFKKYVLEAGGTEDPMELYKKFRGREPRVEALLRNRGLLKDDEPEKTDINMPGGK